MQHRERALERLGNDRFDAIVIGGGINGAVSTLALASSGARVACVTRGDFGGGTSQETSNLIWGGFTYLKGYEIPLVAGLCASRNRLARAFPSRLVETRFLATLDRDSPYSPWFATMGAYAYWLLGRFHTDRPRHRSSSWVAAAEPSVDTTTARGAVEYSDYVLVDNDARFVAQLLLDAAERGAVISNYTEVVGAERAAGRWAVRLVDTCSGTGLDVSARLLVNATGPYLQDVGELVASRTARRIVLSKGIHLIVPQVTASRRVLAFYDDSRRLFYVIPMGHRSAIGTTDSRTGDPDEGVTDEDRRYVLDEVNKRLRLPEPLDVDDVIAERVGVRPLAVDRSQPVGDEEWTALSRRHYVEVDRERAVISILGGKLSDCLNVGEEVLEVAASLGVGRGRGLDGQWFGEPSALARADFAREAAAAGLDWAPRFEPETTYAAVLWRRYGHRAGRVVELVREAQQLGVSMMELADYSEAEIQLVRETEWVVTLDDFLRRRTPLAQLNRPADLAADRGVQRAAELLLGERGPVELRQAARPGTERD
jgi:glycerol-3-phosphate dehydrogenase